MNPCPAIPTKCSVEMFDAINENPITTQPSPRPAQARAGSAGQEPSPAELLHLAERQVLLGWLDGPELPLSDLAAAMKPGIHDRLINSPAGALLIARGLGRQDDDAGERGAETLRQATTLALVLAAAQTDREQEAARQRLLEANRALFGAAQAETVDRDLAIRQRQHQLNCHRHSLTFDGFRPGNHFLNERFECRFGILLTDFAGEPLKAICILW